MEQISSQYHCNKIEKFNAIIYICIIKDKQIV